jgi:hypothetical protein
MKAKRYSLRVEASTQRSADLLTRRIAKLDSVPYRGTVSQAHHSPHARLLAHFAWVMSDFTDTLMKAEAGRHAIIAPAVADEMVSASRLLGDIAAYEPSLVTSPLRTGRQHWVAVAERDSPIGAVSTQPRATCFRVPSASADDRAAVQPWAMGLYTSTATFDGVSMWREYLEPFRGSTLYPLPWNTWEMAVDADNIRVAEIVSASKWVEFVETYALTSDGLVYPDWVEIAHEFDAVHVTLPAIVAAQGFYFDSVQGLIAPAFWDVETTFWLRWCFSGARLVETVDSE